LYFHLSMRADDDGFVNNPNKIARTIGANKNDIDVLIAKRFILTFESGVIVIKHWRINNYLQNDRIKATMYQEELSLLELKDNKSYTEKKPCIQSVSKVYTQGSIGENSIEESNIEKNKRNGGEYLVTSIPEEPPPALSAPTLEEVIAYAKSINKTAFAIQSAKKFFAYFETKDWKKSGGDSVLERGWKKEFDYWLAKDEKDRTDKKPSKPDVDVPWLEDYLATYK